MERSPRAAQQVRGSTVKFVGNRFLPNVITYSLLMVLTYAALVQAHLIQTPNSSPLGPPLQRAAVDQPERTLISSAFGRVSPTGRHAVSLTA